jgi:uncharacterized protein YgiM (DUF1202 family)
MHLTRPIFALALATLLCMPMGVQAQTGTMVNVKKPMNMRAGAGTQHEAMWLLGAGYPLQVIGARGKWLQVRDFEGDQGWVYRPLTGTQAHHVVKAEVANIRQGPGTNTRIVGKANYGDVLLTLERRADWVKVRPQQGRTGWIARRLLWGW